MASDSVSCPLCASPQTRVRFRFASPSWVETRFTVRECLSCHHLFTDPPPGPDLLKRIYDSEAHTEFQTDPAHTENRHLADDLRWDWITECLPPGLLVDVGCGSGTFLSRVPSKAWRVAGVEPQASLAAFAGEHYGLAVAPSIEKAVATHGAPDLVTLWDVLEHLPDPRESLAQLRDVLADGGHLLIGVPHTEGRVARWAGGHWCGWSVPAHLHHYTPATLTRLVREAGLEVLDVRFSNYGFYLNVSWERLMGRCDAEGGAFAAVPSLPVRSLRILERLLPGVMNRVRDQIFRSTDRRLGTEEHASERDYFTVLARKGGAR